MKSATPIALSSRVLSLGVMVMFFMVGCSKHENDCPAPESDDDQVTSRSVGADDGQGAAKDEVPTGASYRGAEAGDDDIDGDGISDDGDDEADGEGNKKGRTQH